MTVTRRRLRAVIDREGRRTRQIDMGARYQFSCNACGYSADVSGGPDGGETIRTVTITCATCKKSGM